MNAEIETYNRELGWILGQFIITMRDLNDTQINWRPDTGQANSACAIRFENVVMLT